MEAFFNETPGLKMLFANGTLYQTNVMLEDNEFEYYRLVGEAYNNRLLERAKFTQKQAQELIQKLSVSHNSTTNASLSQPNSIGTN